MMKVKKVGQWIQAEHIGRVIYQYDHQPFAEYSTEQLLNISRHLDKEMKQLKKEWFASKPVRLMAIMLVITALTAIIILWNLPNIMFSHSNGNMVHYVPFISTLLLLSCVPFVDRQQRRFMRERTLRQKHKQEIEAVLEYRRYENFKKERFISKDAN